jgi:hypothetical protein
VREGVDEAEKRRGGAVSVGGSIVEGNELCDRGLRFRGGRTDD